MKKQPNAIWEIRRKPLDKLLSQAHNQDMGNAPGLALSQQADCKRLGFFRALTFLTAVKAAVFNPSDRNLSFRH